MMIMTKMFRQGRIEYECSSTPLPLDTTSYQQDTKISCFLLASNIYTKVCKSTMLCY